MTAAAPPPPPPLPPGPAGALGVLDAVVDLAVVAVDAALRVVAWSRGAEALLGWSAAEMGGQALDRLQSAEPGEVPLLAPLALAAARADGHHSAEHAVRRRDGSAFAACATVFPRTDGAAGFVLTLRDMTGERRTRAALERALVRAELVTRAARLGTFEYDLVHDVLTWDDACRALFGLSPGAPVSYRDAFLRGVHPDDRAAADAAVERALDPAGDGTFEIDYRTIGIEDGVLRHVAARGQAYVDGGRPVVFIGTVQDVTAARHAEARLRETEQRLRYANRATNDAIWDWDLARDHVTWNEAVEVAYGHRLADVEPTGAWWIGHIHPEDRARVDAAIHAVIDSGGNEWTADYRFERADGSHADVRDRGYVIRDEAGTPLRMVGAMLDLSEQRSLERHLRHTAIDLAVQAEASAAEVERLWATSPDLLVLIDADGTYRRVNPAWTATLGWTRDELIGRTATSLAHPDDLPGTVEAMATARLGTLPSFVHRLRHKDGGHRWISWVAAPEGGTVFASGRDVTQARTAAAALRDAEDALRQSQKVEALGQLTGGVAHDFNNFLTVIRSAVQLLRRPGLADDRRARYVDAIAETADRAARLTSQLLAFARRQALQPQVFDAAAAIVSLQDMLGTLTGASVERVYALPDPSERPALVSADPSQFDTAVVNMAVNARDAMPGGGRLTIGVRRVAALPAARGQPAVELPHVAVSIADTGAGIPADARERIFEPFFTTKEVGQGTGLGLSQVWGFAKQSAGEIRVESEVGRGSTFTLWLPLAAGAPVAIEDRRLDLPDAAGTRILVVEDNDEVGRFALEALADLGYATHWSPDADAALAELARSAGRYDIVFTDVVMPGKSGIELAEEIRVLHPGLPVVLTSGYSHVLAQQGTRGFDLLHKPYSIDELGAVLAKVAPRRPGEG